MERTSFLSNQLRRSWGMTTDTPAPYNGKVATYLDAVMNEEIIVPTYEQARPVFWEIWKNRAGGTVHVDAEDAWIPREFLKWLIQDPTCEIDLNKGIFFMGSHGCGKTTLMHAGQIFANVYLRESYQYKSIAGIKLQMDAAKSVDVINHYLKGDWCFDDIGQMDENIVIFSKYNIVELLICGRIDTRWKTLATSNLLPSEISDRYGPVVASRFNQLFTPMGFTTSIDHRKNSYS